MNYEVRFTAEATQDLERLFTFLAAHDLPTARRAIDIIDRAWAMLEVFPFACRKPDPEDPFLRELLIPFGGAGYVALFEIADGQTVNVLAVRHQREDDYQ
ncbi:type II toxin-antitoxin system RelE/ParE family toxin [bacterium]|nr:type II toxin-antitoxin system RelE/ParE family toxin [bacterium]